MRSLALELLPQAANGLVGLNGHWLTRLDLHALTGGGLQLIAKQLPVGQAAAYA